MRRDAAPEKRMIVNVGGKDFDISWSVANSTAEDHSVTVSSGAILPSVVTIIWGDGDRSEFSLPANTPITRKHTYFEKGEYDIKLGYRNAEKLIARASITETEPEIGPVDFMAALLTAADERLLKLAPRLQMVDAMGGTFEQEGIVTEVASRRVRFSTRIQENVGRHKTTIYWQSKPRPKQTDGPE